MTLLLAGITCVMSLLLTGVARTYALRHEVVDRPTARSSHNTPTPRGGGIAILVASALGMAIGVAARLTETNDAFTLGLGMLLLGVVGWIDDRRGLKVRTRLIVHIGVAIWTLHMFGGLPALRMGTTSMEAGRLGYLIGAVGIVWSINLFNFMDGIDGLAGSQAIIIFGSAALLLSGYGVQSLATISAVVAAASAGFLVWNWPPAKMFLGDVGSGPIGYLAAGLAIASENRGSVPLLVFGIIACVLISDTTVTLARRFTRGERLGDAHRHHAYQRLAQAWGSHRRVTVLAAILTLGFAGLGAIGAIMPRLLIPALLVSYGCIAVILVATERRAPM